MSDLPAFATWLPRQPDVRGETSHSRVLLMVQDFPPRNSVGAARWEGFAPFLERATWEMDVVMEDPHDVRDPDWRRLERLPAALRVATCKRRRPEWYQALRRARGAKPVTAEVSNTSSAFVAATAQRGLSAAVRQVMNHMVRASESRMLLHELATTASAIVDARHKVVVSSGPSHYVHVAAATVARKHNLPHIVDLRDPWARVIATTPLDVLLADDQMRSHEADTLARAALIITNTNAAADVLGGRFPRLKERIRCIPNGSDVMPVMTPTVLPTVFQIAHTGSLYLDRDPRPFMRAVASVRKKLKLDASQMRVVFMGFAGRTNGQSLSELAAAAGIGDMFDDRAPGTRDAAHQLMCESMMAVAFQGDTKTQIPAKIFEYVSFPLWVLALVGADSATADLLAGSDALVFNSDDELKTAEAIEHCYKQFRAGNLPRPVGYDGRFSRERQAERLIAELKTLTKG
ncbi:MAG: hypothetical protein H7Z40_15245 [Phycisphaerae bacterium]|nr:hypothetical protein [Gemmatimonadaceae bacterium]